MSIQTRIAPVTLAMVDRAIIMRRPKATPLNRVQMLDEIVLAYMRLARGCRYDRGVIEQRLKEIAK